MKKQYSLIATLFLILLPVCAQQNELKYRRSSIYSIMVKHQNQQFADDIDKVFNQMPVPDKYNNHDLSVKVVSVDENKLKDEEATIRTFLNQNHIASHLVGRWFNRDVATGQCDMELIKSRGLYNASVFDQEVASKTVRGKAMLEDAGLDLIGNTFVLVNDIRYIDRGAGSSVIGALSRVAGAVATYAINNNSLGDNYFEGISSAVESYKGFKVKIHTYLYRLKWNDEVANQFYDEGYADVPDQQKRDYFDQHRSNFQLEYVGEQESSGSKVSFLGINDDQPLLMVRKACQRALDENVANLQHNFDVFKVKEALISIDPITAAIGKKEGLNENSKYEVLEIIADKDGGQTLKRVGTIAPEKGKIWDNRYMASEEKAEGADLGYTTFRKLSGGDFYEGMLIREIK